MASSAESADLLSSVVLNVQNVKVGLCHFKMSRLACAIWLVPCLGLCNCAIVPLACAIVPLACPKVTARLVEICL